MNRKEVIAAVAEKTGISLEDSEKAVRAFTDIVTDELKNGGKVQLLGFGTFEAAERPAHEGRNPFTGETMQVPASRSPKFKAGKALKDAVKG